MPDAERPLAYRIPPGQIAALIVVAIPFLAVNVYLHPAAPVRLLTLLFGFTALVAAGIGARMYLVVDDEGAAVRYVRAEQWLPWPEVARVEIVSGVRGSDTIRFVRTNGTYVNVPPTLLQPSRPSGRPAARRHLQDIVRQIEGRRAAA
jgi:hypothetical protein